MKPEWWCMDCAAAVELSKAGYCARCGSDALDIAVRPAVTPEALAATYFTIEELEELWRMT